MNILRKLFSQTSGSRNIHPSFHHGIHPPQYKEETARLPIRQFPFAPLMMIPFAQHIGKPAIAVVREGQEVSRGQMLAKADGFLSAAIHAPAAGLVKRIGLMPSVNGKMLEGIYLQTYAASTQEIIEGKPVTYDASVDDILLAIQNAGIVGLGGAAFPTHAKLKPPEGKSVEVLLINGAECEPYLTTDHRVMLEQTEDIFSGIKYLLKVTGSQRAVIGIEDNKQDAIDCLTRSIPPDLPVEIISVVTKYPQGAEKMLIKALFNREVLSGTHAVDVHVAGVNVATCAEIGRLLPHGRGIQERVITVSGPAIINKGNYRSPIGTPLRFVLDTVGVSENLSMVFMGGPMMGPATSSLDTPITKGISGIIAFTTEEMAQQTKKVYPCIHCGHCLQACPMFLNPSRMGQLAMHNEFDAMLDQYHLRECFECGACSFVCPSHIPLVQYFRVAKSALQKKARHESH